ncbi:MAG TPA: hypothetical protein VLT89_06150 [Usitatibacter sp.]|nr:hypothetical protein [Usitatibacter sp.]
MSERDSKTPETRDEDGAPRAKKAYQKPAFRYEKVFETMALACGKISGTQASCRANRRNS